MMKIFQFLSKPGLCGVGGGIFGIFIVLNNPFGKKIKPWERRTLGSAYLPNEGSAIGGR